MPSNMSGFYALKQRHVVITLTVFNVLSVWVFTSGWSISPITFEVVMLKLVCYCILGSRSVAFPTFLEKKVLRA